MLAANEKIQIEEVNQYYLFIPDLFGSINNFDTRKQLEYRCLIKMDKYPIIWVKYLANEVRRLLQGIGYIKSPNTIFFIQKYQLLDGFNITYVLIIVDYVPHK